MNCGWCYKPEAFPATHVSVYGCWVCGHVDEVYFCRKHQEEIIKHLKEKPDAYGHSTHQEKQSYGESCLPYEWVHGKLPC